MTRTIERAKVEKAIAPAKRWRNWYVVIDLYYSEQNACFRNVGDKVPAPELWPSKEVAEQKATDYVPSKGSALEGGFLEYLGAFPVSK